MATGRRGDGETLTDEKATGDQGTRGNVFNVGRPGVSQNVSSPVAQSPSVIIIGGGFAGLSAATALVEKGFAVHVVEGRQILGGRAYSFTDPSTHDSVDNGQHLFMGCYRETLAFLKRIGASLQLEFQSNLKEIALSRVTGGAEPRSPAGHCRRHSIY